MKREERMETDGSFHNFQRHIILSVKQEDQGRKWKIPESVEKQNGITDQKWKRIIKSLQGKALEKI